MPESCLKILRQPYFQDLRPQMQLQEISGNFVPKTSFSMHLSVSLAFTMTVAWTVILNKDQQVTGAVKTSPFLFYLLKEADN